MPIIKHRTAAGLGVLALTAATFTGLSISSQADAAGRNGACEKGEFCYNFNSDLKGAWSDFTGSVGDYGTTQPGCYEFKGKGKKGAGKCIKNNAGGFWNRSSKPVTVYFNSGYGGRSATLKPGAKGKLPAAVYNNNASHRIGKSGGGNPPSGSKRMSQALYVGGGGRLTCKFDGYTSQSGRHEGIDFAKGYGSSVRSLVSGTVIRAGGDSIATLAIYLPKENKTVIYLHSNPKVRVGQKVTRGQVIATEARNGAGSMTHTHVEYRPGKHPYASKSVDDPHLDNPDPTRFWNAHGYVES
ncbi:peptidoglycan DD-metalloendopeptidase family protein [Luteipulveratus sp. YIM 133132]|uniref:peptidoglycan DD-metalloendopeptidase family protein n=1 Tax=Luteipulveratus flavus TaxID=3031728 RepID=UPI0023AF9476|nr:peptidoglycan DD-metalloendopeptidase family protein [Luteipulveratus sp. YIM 133132]MDE9364373.1 peptidoglycan DD-metalloendopeptidase family protein [Luteipulveratus sp. YIM 133132]